MLENIKLKGFKSITSEKTLRLKENSIFCGSNSSGKSTLIQSILMLGQTFYSRYSRDSLVLNGYMTRLGSFEDIKNYHSKDEVIDIDFSVDLKGKDAFNKLKKIDIKFTFGKKSKSKSGIEENPHPILLSATINLHIVNEAGVAYVEELEISQAEGEVVAGEYIISSEGIYKVNRLASSDLDVLNKQYPEYRILGCEKVGIFPYSLLIEYDYTKKISSQIIGIITDRVLRRSSLLGSAMFDESSIKIPKKFFKVLQERIETERQEQIAEFEIPQHVLDMVEVQKHLRNQGFLDTLKRELVDAKFVLSPEIIDESFLNKKFSGMSEFLLFLNTLDQKPKKALIEFIDRNRSLLQAAWYEGIDKEKRIESYTLRSFRDAARYLMHDFPKSIKYLGPLRNEPQAVYPSIGMIEPTNVGLKGEHTAAVLHINRNRYTRYLTPDLKSDGALEFQTKGSVLIDACRDWLSYLGVVKDIFTKDAGKLGYQLSVKTQAQDKWQDLIHVGVGVSQVLPLVLMSLLSDEDDILIFEQPELHLHPKVQSRLCDFFIAMALSGRQCIIETHSEYLINRLRLRMAQSRDDEISKRCAIYFITKADKYSSFEEININRYGAIIEWPDDFFDQTNTEVENILIEASKKKKEEKVYKK